MRLRGHEIEKTNTSTHQRLQEGCSFSTKVVPACRYRQPSEKRASDDDRIDQTADYSARQYRPERELDCKNALGRIKQRFELFVGIAYGVDVVEVGRCYFQRNQSRHRQNRQSS